MGEKKIYQKMNCNTGSHGNRPRIDKGERPHKNNQLYRMEDNTNPPRSKIFVIKKGFWIEFPAIIQKIIKKVIYINEDTANNSKRRPHPTASCPVEKPGKYQGGNKMQR